LADDYRDIASLVLTIDGLQPEKGHETLYVVRELRRKRVWFAEPLLSSATPEVRRVIALARQWAERQACWVWMSDKQECWWLITEFQFPPPLQNPFCGIWPSPCWSWTVRLRSKRRVPRIVGAPRPLSLPPGHPGRRDATCASRSDGVYARNDLARARQPMPLTPAWAVICPGSRGRGGRGGARVLCGGARHAQREPGWSTSPARFTDE
jgi:hypothetical protein